MKSFFKKHFRKILITTSLGVFIIFSINYYIVKTTENYVFTEIEKLPKVDAIIVLGAKVNQEKLSYVLEDRLVAGINIIYANKAEAILLSGDHGQKEYDEVNSMRKYILRRNFKVKKEQIFMDHAGFDTYDSMFRAKEIFDIKSAIIVTQDFHINRSVYIARNLGINAYGFAVNEDMYKESVRFNWKIREILTRVKAFKDILISSNPTYLGEKIPITGNGMKSWDTIEKAK
ncbi:SanA/YdcF family protein [Flavobacterium difficile]|uniref:SanA protein n=1 Tax=Flavobacterium difficile TaxID=2709659 RepID=A0ABX0I8B6_9FLAO|nr:ElyC/SanA/YdcF family protein [Flavobacterium difficile]NHM02852.1 SanA protein [Flavobacterium difficile]